MSNWSAYKFSTESATIRKPGQVAPGWPWISKALSSSFPDAVSNPTASEASDDDRVLAPLEELSKPRDH